MGGALNELVVGLKSSEVGGASAELVGAHREERVVGEKKVSVGEDWDGMVHASARLAADGDETHTVSGRAVVSAGPGVATEAETEVLEAQKLTLEVAGKPAIVMDAQGNVSVFAANLTLDGSEIALKGGTLKKIQPESVAEQQTWIEIELIDETGRPAANERYELHLANGEVRGGRLNSGGKARIEQVPPGSCHVEFPDVGGD